MLPDLDVVRQLGPEALEGLQDQGLELKRNALAPSGAAEDEDLIHQVLLPVRRAEHLRENLVGGALPGQILEQHLGVQDDGIEHVVQVVGDLGRQPAQKLQSLHLSEPPLGLSPALPGALQEMLQSGDPPLCLVQLFGELFFRFSHGLCQFNPFPLHRHRPGRRQGKMKGSFLLDVTWRTRVFNSGKSAIMGSIQGEGA